MAFNFDHVEAVDPQVFEKGGKDEVVVDSMLKLRVRKKGWSG